MAKSRLSFPVPAEIHFLPKENIEDKTRFISFGTLLYQLGFIQEEPREIRLDIKNDKLILVCTFVNLEASKIWLNNQQIKKHYLPLMKVKPVIRKHRSFIDEIDQTGVCDCKTHGSYILIGQPYDYKSALKCGKCLNSIPGYRIDKSIDVESWSRLNQHFMDIWFASGEYEKFVKHELESFSSELNKKARKIINQLQSPCVFCYLERIFKKRGYMSKLQVKREKIKLGKAQ